jgi:hypothetical protein
MNLMLYGEELAEMFLRGLKRLNQAALLKPFDEMSIEALTRLPQI